MANQNEILLDTLETLERLTPEVLNSLDDSNLKLLKHSLETEASIISSILSKRTHQQTHFKPESKKTN